MWNISWSSTQHSTPFLCLKEKIINIKNKQTFLYVYLNQSFVHFQWAHIVNLSIGLIVWRLDPGECIYELSPTQLFIVIETYQLKPGIFLMKITNGKSYRDIIKNVIYQYFLAKIKIFLSLRNAYCAGQQQYDIWHMMALQF